jgi:tetratricopeptide (TPR) repeat protein
VFFSDNSKYQGGLDNGHSPWLLLFEIILDPAHEDSGKIHHRQLMSASQHFCVGGDSMSNVNRNDPCPCGSGKKFKRCCRTSNQPEKIKNPARDLPKRNAIASSHLFGLLSEDQLVIDSNRVVDLIHENRLDEAETVAAKLLIDYPEVHDGFERLAMVYEAQGNLVDALEMYENALQFTIRNFNSYDDEFREYYRDKIVWIQKTLQK